MPRLIYDDSHRSVAGGNVSRVQERDNKPVVMDKHDTWLFTFRVPADDICIPYSILVMLLNDMQIQLSFNMTTGTISQYQQTAKNVDATAVCVMPMVS